MKFKDIIELGTYDYHENATVEIFDMKNFKKALSNDQFTEILIPNENKDTELYPYAFVIDGTTLITTKGED